MALNNAALVVAPTSIAPTGGTALAFSSAGQAANGSVTLYVPADTDLRLRRSINVSVKTPTSNPNTISGWTQARASAIYKKPKLLASGKVTVNTIRVEVAFDPETTAAEVQELLDVGAQMLFDADFTPTFKSLSLT